MLQNIRWPVRDIAIFFFFLKLSRDNSNFSRDKLKLSRNKMSSYRVTNEKILKLSRDNCSFYRAIISQFIAVYHELG